MMRTSTFASLGWAILLTWLGGFCQAQTLADDLLVEADIVVDINGTGDYTTVQEGLNAAPDSSDDWTVIFIKKGIYQEKVILNHKKTKVVLVGEDVDSTIITNDDYGDKMLPGGHTFSTHTFRADPHDFQAYNLTFENPSRQGQAVAFRSNGDRQILYHCKMLGYQDTYFDNFRTRRYIKDCYIRGDVDFIFGFGVTLFDSCQLHCVDDGYITASATPQHYDFGHVFTNCWITSPDHWSPDIYLGRPWFPYANTAFLYTWQTSDVFSIGWGRWDGRENTCLYYEYENYGPGFRPDRRLPFGQFLDSAAAQRYQADTIFAAATFPSDLGPAVDSTELWSVRQRFEDAGYAERADTIKS
jgi:pectinesterase